jgi:hypothetical protein
VGVKVLILQRLNASQTRWVNLVKISKRARASGYLFRGVVINKAAVTKLRVQLYGHRKGVTRNRLLDNSNTPRLNVLSQTCASDPSPVNCPKPADKIQTRVADDPNGQPTCAPAGGGTFPLVNEERHQPYVWDPVALEWTPGDPLEWVVVSSAGTRAATAAECPVPVAEQLPDLVVQNLNSCSPAEQAKSQVGCFRVEPFTQPDGSTVTLLKFPASTFNIGAGAMEVRSHRDNPQDGIASWHDTLSVQRIYRADGSFRDRDITSAINFYWEDEPNGAVDSHGHHHWHILDFDSYSDNGVGSVQEKHGFCISSSGTTGPSLPGAGTLDPAYDDISACGFGQPNVADIVHGLSPLYGDTYPSSLDDQGINITGNVDGVHKIKVCADQGDLLLESNETNNCASADVTVSGGVVTSVANATGH